MKKGQQIGAEMLERVLAEITEGKLNYRCIADKYAISHQVVSSIALKNGIRKRPEYKKERKTPGKPIEWDSELTTEWELTTKWFMEELHEKQKAIRSNSADNSIWSFCNIYKAGRSRNGICQQRRGTEGEIKAWDKR